MYYAWSWAVDFILCWASCITEHRCSDVQQLWHLDSFHFVNLFLWLIVWWLLGDGCVLEMACSSVMGATVPEAGILIPWWTVWGPDPSVFLNHFQLCSYNCYIFKHWQQLSCSFTIKFPGWLLHLHNSIYKSRIRQMTEGYKTCHNTFTIHKKYNKVILNISRWKLNKIK